MTKADKILNKHLSEIEAKYIADKRFLYESLIDAINEALDISSVSNWVACKDKLPLYYDSYLVVWQNDVLQLFFDEKEKIWHTNDMEEYKNVTHWMELPEPPCY